MRKPKLVVWDVETALVDVRTATADALQQTLANLGHALPKRAILQSHGGLEPDAYVGQLCPELPPAQHRVVVSQFLASLELSEHPSVDLFPGTEHVVLSLQHHGFSQAAVGWTPSSEAHECFESLGLDTVIDKLIAEGDTRRAWPHPAALTQLLHELQVPAAHTIVVTGTAHGVHSARKVGARVWAAAWGPDPEDELLEEDPSGLIRDPAQLVRALVRTTTRA